MSSCNGCSYYELDILGILPFEHCHKHNWNNKKPCDFTRCPDYTTSKWILIKILIKSAFKKEKR